MCGVNGGQCSALISASLRISAPVRLLSFGTGPRLVRPVYSPRLAMFWAMPVYERASWLSFGCGFCAW